MRRGGAHQQLTAPEGPTKLPMRPTSPLPPYCSCSCILQSSQAAKPQLAQLLNSALHSPHAALWQASQEPAHASHRREQPGCWRSSSQKLQDGSISISSGSSRQGVSRRQGVKGGKGSRGAGGQKDERTDTLLSCVADGVKVSCRHDTAYHMKTSSSPFSLVVCLVKVKHHEQTPAPPRRTSRRLACSCCTGCCSCCTCR
jgi:hypothetical protein